MGHVVSFMLGGLAAAASWSMVAPPGAGGGLPRISAAFQALDRADQAPQAINRAAKGDRLAPPRANVHTTVASIEVVGLHHAAIVYRDRAGNVLYRTDPLSNVTVIAKGVKLPDVTVRQSVDGPTRPVPVKVPATSGDGSQMPIGCEPAASPIASPGLSHLTGRCLSRSEWPRAVASASN